MLRIEELRVFHALLFANGFQQCERGRSPARADAVGKFHAVAVRVGGEETEVIGHFAKQRFIVRGVHGRIFLAFAHQSYDGFVFIRHAKVHPRERQDDDANEKGGDDTDQVHLRAHGKADHEDEEDVRHVFRIFDRGAEADQRKSAEDADGCEEVITGDDHDGRPEHGEQHKRELERLRIAETPVRAFVHIGNDQRQRQTPEEGDEHVHGIRSCDRADIGDDGLHRWRL